MKKFILIASLILGYTNLFSQDDLDNLLNAMEEKERPVEYVKAAFKATRVINLQSLERKAPGSLDFRIAHRFGALNSGSYNLFGLDYATMRISLEYGINDFITAGVGRSTYQKTVDAYAKASILRQRKGSRPMPISVLVYSNVAVNGVKWSDPNRTNYFSSRLSYTHQLIIGRKFSETFSFQLSPTVVHKNLVPAVGDPNNIYAVGGAGRIKISRRMALTGEYVYRIPPPTETTYFTNYHNSLSLGLDIETGGHVFQFQLSNSLPMFERGFITETDQSWTKGAIHIGFNITRDFTLKKEK